MKDWLQNHGRALLLLPWIGLVLGLVSTGSFRDYVAGWHLYFQIMALAILVLAYAGELVRSALASRRALGASVSGSVCSCGHEHHHHGALTLPMVLVHLTPLILFWAVGPASLSLQSKASQSLSGLMQALPGREENAPSQKFTPDGYLVTDLGRLHNGYKEKRELPEKVRLIGQIHTVPADKLSTIPPALAKKGVRSYQYRFMIACCAADALPVSVALLSDKPLAAAAGQWFEIKGRPLIIKDKQEHIAVKVEGMAQVPKPKNPYLYAIF